MVGRIVIVNDRMQKGYRYRLTAPTGRNFDPGFKPDLSPQKMLRLGVFCGKYMTDSRKSEDLMPAIARIAINFSNKNQG
jgi:hypothetical protein